MTLFVFHACSTKTSTLSPKSIEILKQKMNSEDEFEDEFASQEEIDTLDPLSAYNRVMTNFNDTLFIYVVNPVSQGYATVIPEFVQESLSNFSHNIQFPIRFANNLLQKKFQNSLEETERFIVNSTVGIAGIFDPARTYMNILAHNEDFGQTLGFYGVGSGFHVVLPFLGPSNIRDIIGLTTDGYISPLIHLKGLHKYKLPRNYRESFGIYGLQILNKNALNLGAYESLKKDAIDLYPFLRDIYEQKRLSDIQE